MFGRYTITSLLTVLVLFAATCLPAAPNHISKLGLSHENGFTVLTIFGNGQFRTAHQSVEAKEGKPFRIVVDCLAARHNLPRKGFTDLPKSVITAIRTSQYAVTPEEVVRVVMDLADETVYRVESEGNLVKVYISDPKTPTFTSWVSETKKVQLPEKSGTVIVPSTQAAAPMMATKTTVKKPSMVKQNDTKTELVQKSDMPEGPVTLTRLSPSNQQAIYGPHVIAPIKPDQKPAVQAKTPTVKEPVTVAQIEKPKPKSPTITSSKPAPKTIARAETKTAPASSGNVSKPVPIQDKLKTKYQAQASIDAPAPVKKAPAVQKPSPEKKTTVAKAPAKPKTRPVITTDLVGQASRKANFFAALDAAEQNPPVPGREPSPLNKDEHKQTTPAKAVAKPAVSPPVSTKAQPASSATAEVKSAPKGKPATVETKAKPPQKAPAPVKQDKTTTLASADAQTTQKTTSRFRRQKAKSTRMKETQVVQFPQRIVTKYSSGGSRDPFEMLIDEIGSRRGAIDLSRVPNIETLYLVGILHSDDGKSSALMEDIDGIGYILKPGNRVKNGYVAQIDNQAIYFQINEYGWSRTIVKHMEKEK